MGRRTRTTLSFNRDHRLGKKFSGAEYIRTPVELQCPSTGRTGPRRQQMNTHHHNFFFVAAHAVRREGFV